MVAKADPAHWKEFSTVIKVTTVFAFLVKLENSDNRKNIGNKTKTMKKKKRGSL